MEYLEGPNMNAALAARDPCLDGRRVHFIRQAAEAIAAVHEAGFIHRDICPRNFMLTNGRQDLKLIDFGLTVPATRWFMQPGNRTGTPNYMAPELVRRRATDQRLDVFAFGVTAYEFCTFELPWLRGTTGMAAMSHDQPPIDIRHYRPDLPPVLAKAIHACIEPELIHRCGSIKDFLRMIRKVPEGGTERQSQTAGSRHSSSWSTHRVFANFGRHLGETLDSQLSTISHRSSCALGWEFSRSRIGPKRRDEE